MAGLAILMSSERDAHPGVALGISVCARRSASQPKTPRASTTTIKILRNEYMTQFATLGLSPTQFKANNGFSTLT